MRELNVQIISALTKFLEAAVENKAAYCKRPQDFTRKRGLSFVLVVLLILNMLKRSLAVELEDFFDRIGRADEVVGKSAFSMARQKLNSVFLRTGIRYFYSITMKQKAHIFVLGKGIL